MKSKTRKSKNADYYLDKLERWFKREKRAGRLVYIKFFPGFDIRKPGAAKAIYEIVTGKAKTTAIDRSTL